jgi:hypothetical protein
MRARSRSLAFTAFALVVLSVVGAFIADAEGLAGFGHAVGPAGSVLSVPLPVLAVEAGGALGAAFARGRGARFAFGVPAALAATLSLAAVAADGDLGAAGLSTAEVGCQVLIAAVTLLLLVLTVARLYASARSPQPAMSATASASPSTVTGASIGSPESQR